MNLSQAIPHMPEWPTLRIPRGVLPATLITIVTLGLVALVPDEAPLTQLELRGDFEHLSVEDVRAAAAPLLDDSFFSVDLDAVHDAVGALPWVASVRAERRWPGAIALRVDEREPVARWNQDGLLDMQARAFVPRAAEIPTGLPRLGGSPGHEAEVMRTWQRIAPVLAGSELELVALQLDARGEWTAHTAAGIELRFGQSPPDERLPMLTGAARRSLGDRWEQVSYVDLRYTNGFAVGWRETEANGEGK